MKYSSDPLTSVTIASNSTLTRDVTGLDKYTEYEFQVLVFSSVGSGPPSPLRVVRTNEDGEMYIDYFMVGERERFLFTSCEE